MNQTKLYSIGSIIYYLRMQKHISQTVLAKGLCSPPTLSRIELSEREPDKLLVDALLQRLGKSPNRFDFILDEQDFNLFQQRETIKSLIEKQQYIFAESKLKYYKNHVKIMTPLQEQFIKKYDSILLWKSTHNLDLSIKYLKESLFITFPYYSSSIKSKLQLTLEETTILFEIAIIYKEIKNFKKAISILTYLISYYDNYESDDDEIIKLYSSLIFSAAHIYYLNKDYKNASIVCDKGIMKASGHNHLHYFAELLCIRASSKEQLSLKNISHYKNKSIIKDYLAAITLFSLNSQKELIDKIELYLKETYSWEYIQSEMLFKNQEFPFL